MGASQAKVDQVHIMLNWVEPMLGWVEPMSGWVESGAPQVECKQYIRRDLVDNSSQVMI